MVESETANCSSTTLQEPDMEQEQEQQLQCGQGQKREHTESGTELHSPAMLSPSSIRSGSGGGGNRSSTPERKLKPTEILTGGLVLAAKLIIILWSGRGSTMTDRKMTQAWVAVLSSPSTWRRVPKMTTNTRITWRQRWADPQESEGRGPAIWALI